MSETIDSLTGEVSQKNIADIINEARAADRISARDIIDKVFNDFFELHGDRQLTDDEAIVGGIARFNNQAVTVIGIQKGRNLAENLATNFGQPSPNGYRKALRLMKQAEKFGQLVLIQELKQKNVDKVKQLLEIFWKCLTLKFRLLLSSQVKVVQEEH